jgi:Pyruvate/2-oxoacid:ferredoxin oxidoreductase delta subunit
MSAEIYFFSGTGNSFVVARDLSNKIQGTLIPAVSLIHRDSIRSDADVIGFVFPIYDFKPPGLVIECVKKIEGLDSKYIFTVCTYGIAPLKAIRVFDESLRANGGRLSSGFAVKMPHNGLGSGSFSQARHEQMFEDWKARLEEISEYVNSGKEGTLETSKVFSSLILSGVMIRRIPFLLKLSKQVMMKGWDSLAFVSNERCDGCGICKKVCPVDNIEIIDGKPLWSDHSVNCFACYHWCPKAAIQCGNSNMNIRQYHHPEARAVDIIRQKDVISLER